MRYICRRIRWYIYHLYNKEKRWMLLLILLIMLLGVRTNRHNTAMKIRDVNLKVADENVLATITKLVNGSKGETTFCMDVTCVLVQGYFRGGTTMTFDSLTEAGNNFHVFEPIMDLTEKIHSYEYITFYGGTSKNIPMKELPKAQADMLMYWFDCKFSQLNMGDLKHPNLVHHSKVTRKYFSCIRHSALGFCIKMLESVCLPQAVRIAKVVRLRMNALVHLLVRNKDLKVIYIIRDPRAMIQSLVTNKLLARKNVSDYAYKLCQDIMLDLRATSILKQHFAANLFVLKYEALFRDPIKSFKMVFNFTNLPFSQRADRFIRHHLMQQSKAYPGNPWLTRTGDGYKIANQWRFSVTQNDLNLVDNACLETYRLLGYKKMDLQTLQDIDIPTLQKPLKEEVFNLY